jgi:hypothetical protein
MISYPRFNPLSAMFGLAISLIIQTAFGASKEPQLEKLTIPISSEAELTFTMPMKSRANLNLLRSDNKKARDIIVGRITITDEGCALGHQVSIYYEKKPNEYLTVYFPKEIPWDTTYKLRVSRNAEELTINLNGETISVTPLQKAKFIQVTKDPKSINILNTEQH